MDIIEQITDTVLSKMLPETKLGSNETDLLSQFIAIFAGKVAGTEGLSLNPEVNGSFIMQSVFTESADRVALITNLSEVHSVDSEPTQYLITKATPVISGELNRLAEGGCLQSMLEEHLLTLGNWMPDWSVSLLPEELLVKLEAATAKTEGIDIDLIDNTITPTDDTLDEVSDKVVNIDETVSSVQEIDESDINLEDNITTTENNEVDENKTEAEDNLDSTTESSKKVSRVHLMKKILPIVSVITAIIIVFFLLKLV